MLEAADAALPGPAAGAYACALTAFVGQPAGCTGYDTAAACVFEVLAVQPAAVVAVDAFVAAGVLDSRETARAVKGTAVEIAAVIADTGDTVLPAAQQEMAVECTCYRLQTLKASGQLACEKEKCLLDF